MPCLDGLPEVNVNFSGLLNWGGLWYWLVFSIVFGYFMYHVVGGGNGLSSYFRTRDLIAAKTAELEALKDKCDSISRNVHLLSSGSLDLDLLEERCMVVLNYCYPSDIVVR
jgi:cell division protein FtsB